MSVERKLWLISPLIFVTALAASAGVMLSAGTRLSEFPAEQIASIKKALRPDREPRKIETAASLQDIETLHVVSTSTKIIVMRDEHLQDLALTLEGRFAKSDQHPLVVEKSGRTMTLKIDGGVNRISWASAFDDSGRNGALTILLPRQWTGKLELESVSGDAQVKDLSLGEFDWKTISGELEVRGGEMHVAHLKSVSGDIDYDSETMEFYMTQTSGDADVEIEGLEHFIVPKIDVNTVSGRVDLAISDKASIRISLSSFTGQTTSTVDLKKSMHSAGALEGQLGPGGGELRLRSVSGTVHLSTF